MANNSITKQFLKNHFHKTLSIFSLTIFSLIFTCLVSAENLDYYLSKYKNIEITDSQLSRLASVDYLVKYFSSFSYFENNVAVSSNFIRALILAESNCIGEARSSKNALGLTQIIYPTGKQAAIDIVQYNKRFLYINNNLLQNLGEQDLHDPAINILLTCFLISKYNYKYHGQLDLVVSAWNAGTGSIKNGQPPPYKETLNLIGRVNGFYRYLMNNEINLVSNININSLIVSEYDITTPEDSYSKAF